MKKSTVIVSLIVALSAVSVPIGTVWAGPSLPYHASIDVSGITGSDFELEIAFYDNSGAIGDSWAFIDNVVFGAQTDNFEGGGIGGFVIDPLNADSVNVVGGSLNGSGVSVLRIDEDPFVTPTFAYRDYTGSGATSLSFDLRMIASDTAGPFGLDELVFNILDPITLDPLLPGIFPGFGNVLSVNSSGVNYTNDVAVSVIPAPSTLLLGSMGVGFVSWLRRRRTL